MERLLSPEEHNDDMETKPKEEKVFEIQPGVDPKIIKELSQQGAARKAERETADQARIQEIKDSLDTQTEKEPERLFITHITTPVKENNSVDIPILTEEEFDTQLQALEERGMAIQRERDSAKAAVTQKQAELKDSAEFIDYLEYRRKPLETKATDTMSDRFFNSVLNTWDKINTYPSLMINQRKHSNLSNQLEQLQSAYHAKEDALAENQRQSMGLIRAWQNHRNKTSSDNESLAA